MDWITHIITFLVGLGSGWSLRIVFTSRKNVDSSTSNVNNNEVTQIGNKVSRGSIVGRDQNRSH
ncbi:hypothetical protein C5470_10690 [Photorhabdus stackebrandtii]|uniref:Uncharacterized protein n=1 Tax=Photorhabdus stackebrandtii TaxID=1123042 RepID=A0A7X5QM02_9GAMM|nr:hypothetical protein [Photorhabdus stackebrandtii]